MGLRELCEVLNIVLDLSVDMAWQKQVAPLDAITVAN